MIDLMATPVTESVRWEDRNTMVTRRIYNDMGKRNIATNVATVTDRADGKVDLDIKIYNNGVLIAGQGLLGCTLRPYELALRPKK
jgi:hypothetical protein